MIGILLGALLFFSGETDRILAEAFAKYRSGEYAVARDLYARAAAEGAEGGEVRYNLGNCEARVGDYAKALAEYRRAEKFLPRDGDLRHNIEVVRRKLGFSTEAPGLTDTLRGLLTAFTRRELLFAALLFEALFFGLRALHVLRPFGILRLSSTCAGLGLFLALAFLGHEVFVRAARREAVVLSESAARSEPRADREEVLRLRPGVEVRLLGRERDWVRIRAPGGGLGWVPAESVETI